MGKESQPIACDDLRSDRLDVCLTPSLGLMADKKSVNDALSATESGRGLDFESYRRLSDQRKVPLRCPYASVERCPRYYKSLSDLEFGLDAGTTLKRTAKRDAVQAVDSLRRPEAEATPEADQPVN